MGNSSAAILLYWRQAGENDSFRGWHLPAILPQSDRLHTLLWDAHFYLAFAFFALILLHVAAALFHALVRRDGVFETMASV